MEEGYTGEHMEEGYEKKYGIGLWRKDIRDSFEMKK